MIHAAELVALHARLVVPVSAPPIRSGVITVQGDRIVAVGENVSGRAAIDLGDVAILPALINAHTHLELSDRVQPIGSPGVPLPLWILELVQERRGQLSQGVDLAHRYAIARRRGFELSRAAGVAAVGDIISQPPPQGDQVEHNAHGVAFREALGHSAARVAEQELVFADHVRWAQQASQATAGFSPHAPYTCSLDMVAMAVRWSQTHRLPLAMHLAESREELQLLSAGNGLFREVLEQLGVWNAADFAGGRSPHDYLKLLDHAHRALIVHGNYLDAADWRWLAERSSRLAVVYCPRTHAYFGHDPYCLSEMLCGGVRVVVGTDSLASNPDLGVWGELRQVVTTHPEVAPERVLRMGTLDAALALGCDRELGSLVPGKRAEFAIVDMAGCVSDNIKSLLHEANDVHGLPGVNAGPMRHTAEKGA
jgi:cytosine/adenosine deaminase-related metal-dependent hydrolase